MRLLAFPRLSDWPFAVKMGLAPALALAGLLILGVLGSAETISQSRLVHRVAGPDMLAATQLLQAGATLEQTGARLDRLAALNVAGGGTSGNATDITAMQGSLDALSAQLRAVQADANGAQAIALASMQADIAALRDAIGILPDQLHAAAARQDDIRRPIQPSAGMLVSDLNHIAGLVRQDAEMTAARAAQESAWLNGIFIATALLMFVLVTACAVIITRRTVLAVRRIARATLLVANGDQVLQIHKLARRDELGAIVESLRAFQSKNQHIDFLAQKDGLTALANRTLFNERLAHAIAQCGNGLRIAVHSLDLDNFKAVNDTLGHSAGDALLQCVAARLARCVRDTDTVARLGGDEFGIIQVDVDGAQDAGKFAQRIIDTVNQPYELDGQQVTVSTSIGIALTPCADMSPETLPSQADLALYRAKAEGRSTWRIYEAKTDAALHKRRLLELDLRAALVAEQFELHYQPLVDVQSREVNGLEALIRWHHPERGLVAPADFIPLAEKTGLIVQIGGWVLRQACMDAIDWPSQLKVSVNLSPLQFRDSNLVALVQQALAASGLPAWRLELEITNSVLLGNTEMVLATLNKLRAMGICIAMDDFGTGHASISFLRNFSFDKIKIDRSFIRDLAAGSQSSAIVHAVTGLGSSLGIKTTAAGVETEEQLARLVAEGCTEVQGYLFSPPCPARDVIRVVMELSRNSAAALVPLEDAAI